MIDIMQIYTKPQKNLSSCFFIDLISGNRLQKREKILRVNNDATTKNKADNPANDTLSPVERKRKCELTKTRCAMKNAAGANTVQFNFSQTAFASATTAYRLINAKILQEMSYKGECAHKSTYTHTYTCARARIHTF